MNINIEHTTKRNKLKITLIVTALILLACIGYFTVQPAMPQLNASTLNVVTVQQGDIDIMTPVYGQYASRYERLISAPAVGQVSQDSLLTVTLAICLSYALIICAYRLFHSHFTPVT